MQGIFEYAFGDEFDELESTVMKNLQVDRGIQNVFTPIKDIEAKTGFKFSSVLNNDTKTIGILFNTEFIRYILKTFDEDYLNTIEMTFFYDSQFDKKEVERLCVEYRYKKSIELISIEDFTEENKDIKVIVNAIGNKKFDVVFSNPPYETLDLKILQSIFTVAEKIVFIHPTTFLLDNKFKKKIYNDIRNTNYLEYVNLFWGNKLFDIGLFCPLAITIWNTKKSSNMCTIVDTAFSNETYNTLINEISIHHKINYKDFLNNIKNYMTAHGGNIQDHITDEEQLNDYSVRFSLIQGTSHIVDKYSDDFFNLTGKNVEKNKCDHTFRFAKHVNLKLHWSFNNEDERNNYLNYCKTKVVRFLLSFVKSGSHIDRGELEIIPWMDFTKEWNDAKLCKEFNISKELWQYIDKFIPNYYEDYKSGF